MMVFILRRECLTFHGLFCHSSYVVFDFPNTAVSEAAVLYSVFIIYNYFKGV